MSKQLLLIKTLSTLLAEPMNVRSTRWLRKIILLNFVVFSLFANANTPQFVADPQQIKAHLFFLADDLLEGRDTGSRGHDLASLYIATEFAKYGLVPAGSSGYFQPIKFRKSLLVQESTSVELTVNGQSVAIEYPKDYLTGADLLREYSKLEGQMVFVGYGIVAERLGHNDYANLDVSGKVVVMLAGKPRSFPTEEGAHFASATQKTKYAAERGAVGVITISTPQNEQVRPYQRLLNFLHTPSLAWLDQDDKPANQFPSILGSAYFSVTAAEHLFQHSKTTLQDIYGQLESDEIPAGFALDAKIRLEKRSVHSEVASQNVVGVVEGSDPALKNEYVIFSAHSDHIGFSKTVKKDNINNGAMDNASGTAIMLETARMFAQSSIKPARSIMFLSVTGEEKGLLGADYFARNPTIAPKSMIANVNLDMPILTYQSTDVIAFGAEHSDLKYSVEAATEKAGMTLSPDPWPEQGLFTRSDHYAFVKQGVPAVFLVPGLLSADPDIKGEEIFNQFLSTHYHQPSDDIHQPFNWNAATNFAQVNAHIGWQIAIQAARPKWNEGDFFGDTFGR